MAASRKWVILPTAASFPLTVVDIPAAQDRRHSQTDRAIRAIPIVTETMALAGFLFFCVTSMTLVAQTPTPHMPAATAARYQYHM